MSSWWIGLSRDAFRIMREQHHFSWTKRTLITAYNDPQVHAARKNTGAPLSHLQESGFTIGGSYGVTLIDNPADRDYQSQDPAPAAYSGAVAQLEADRAYRNWNAYRFQPTVDQFIAYEAAALLQLYLRFNTTPTDWNNEIQTAFNTWCAERQEQIDPLLRLIE